MFVIYSAQACRIKIYSLYLFIYLFIYRMYVLKLSHTGPRNLLIISFLFSGKKCKFCRWARTNPGQQGWGPACLPSRHPARAFVLGLNRRQQLGLLSPSLDPAPGGVWPAAKGRLWRPCPLKAEHYPHRIWWFTGDDEHPSEGCQDGRSQGSWPNEQQSLLAWLGWWPPEPMQRGARKAPSSQMPVP